MKKELSINTKNEILLETNKNYTVSNIFIQAKKQMKISEMKTLGYALSQIKWNEECPEIIELDKKKLSKIIGINSDENHLSQDLKREIKDITKNSFLEFEDKEKDFYENGFFINKIRFTKNKIKLRFDNDYLSLFGKQEKNFTQLYLNDIINLETIKQYNLYEYMRENIYKMIPDDYGVIAWYIDLEKLKQILNIPSDAYINNRGNFDVTLFEKKILNPITENFKNLKIIKTINKNGKLFERVKKGRKVVGYNIYILFTKDYTIDLDKIINNISDEEINNIKNFHQTNKTKEIKKGYLKNTNINKSSTYEDMDNFEKNILSN